MIWKRLPISWKLFSVICLVMALVIVFISALALINLRQGFALYLADAELSRFDTLEQALIAEHDPNQPGWPQFKGNRGQWNAFARQALPRPNRPRSRPTNLQGNNNKSNRRPPRDPLRLGLRLVLINADGERVVGGNPEREVFARRPIQVPQGIDNAKPIGWIGLTGGSNHRAAGDELFLSDQLKTFGFTALFALLLSAVGAYFLSRQFLKPLRELTLAGRKLTAGEYDIRLQNPRLDELGLLIEQFNSLAENLESSERLQRKWLSDTSHELKTPLAVLQGQIEALQDGVRKPTNETLAQIHASISRLSRLVSDLNLLANAREDQLPMTRKLEDIVAIASDVVDSIEKPATQKNLQLEIDLPSELLMQCDRFRIRQLFDNLLQNSIRYTDASGKIRLTGKKVDDVLQLVIEDSAPAPPTEALSQLFDRFYRVEQSRNRSLGGSGLGLSICREISLAHGGTISAELSQLGGLKVSISLPVQGEKNV